MPLFKDLLEKVKKITIPLFHFDFTKKKLSIVELRDGLTEKEIAEKFDWILKAKIKEAVLGKIGDKLVWYNGIWEAGDWEDGYWCEGIWLDGIWKKGFIKAGSHWRYYGNEDWLSNNWSSLDKTGI